MGQERRPSTGEARPAQGLGDPLQPEGRPGAGADGDGKGGVE